MKSKCLRKPVDSRTLWVKRQLIQEHNPNAVCDKVARSQDLQCWSCIYASHRVSSSNSMVLNATPQKKCAVKWVKWNDGHQQLVVMRCKVSSCGSYAEWHCGMNLSISRCSCWMCVKCCSAVGWKWPWECRSSKLQVVSQQSVLMYHCWPSNCRKDDIGSHILLHLTRACFFQSQHQGHQSTCRQSVMMSSINLSAVMSAVMLRQFSCSAVVNQSMNNKVDMCVNSTQ